MASKPGGPVHRIALRVVAIHALVSDLGSERFDGRSESLVQESATVCVPNSRPEEPMEAASEPAADRRIAPGDDGLRFVEAGEAKQSAANHVVAAPPLPPRNLPYADVMIVGADGSTSALVQVKARTYGKDGGWHMREKHEGLVLERLFYCFVDLEPTRPTTAICHLAERDRCARRARIASGMARGATETRNQAAHGQ
jgi:hypothetical protein